MLKNKVKDAFWKGAIFGLIMGTLVILLELLNAEYSVDIDARIRNSKQIWDLKWFVKYLKITNKILNY